MPIETWSACNSRFRSRNNSSKQVIFCFTELCILSQISPPSWVSLEKDNITCINYCIAGKIVNLLYIPIILGMLMTCLYALKRSKGNFNLFIQNLNHRVENVIKQLFLASAARSSRRTWEVLWELKKLEPHLRLRLEQLLRVSLVFQTCNCRAISTKNAYLTRKLIVNYPYWLKKICMWVFFIGRGFINLREKSG